MRIILPIVPVLLLLVGCTGPAPGPGESDGAAGDQLPDGTGGEDDTPGLAAQEGADNATDPAVPGMVLEGRLTTCDAGFCIDAEARNAGPATYHVSSICVSPWSERMERDGAIVTHREPTAHCLAFGTQPLAPGEKVQQVFSWNGTVWDDATSSHAPADEGAYQWSVALRVYEDEDGAGAHDLRLSFTLVVGST